MIATEQSGRVVLRLLGAPVVSLGALGPPAGAALDVLLAVEALVQRVLLHA